MIYDLINEYLKCAQVAAWVDYSDQESLRLYNTVCERMRAIVHEIVSLGQDAVLQFASILDNEPAALWAAHHLVELANLNSATLLKCFARVEQSRLQAKLKGNLANAMGEEMWLKEWQARKT